MLVESRTFQYGNIFGNWIMMEKIGSGSCGKTTVFRLKRRLQEWQSLEEESALKVVNVIEEIGDYWDQSNVNRDIYLERKKKLCINAELELKMLSKLKDSTNVVKYLDYNFENWNEDNSYGCDLLIRMEMLGVLRDSLRNSTFNDKEIVKVGMDICNALIDCHKLGIIHRDIKPENIFFDNKGNYKLGDFGIARIIRDSEMAHTKIGTKEYAAPEQFIGNSESHYDYAVDIYSLGLVLYELANNNRLPFVESGSAGVNETLLRKKGKPFSRPSDCSSALADVIMKACSYRPEKRFKNAQVMYDELEAILNKEFEDISAEKIGARVKSKNMEVTDQYATEVTLGEKAIINYETEKAAPDKYSQDEEVVLLAIKYLFEGKTYKGTAVLKKAAEDGNASAQAYLATLYSSGTYMNKDLGKAAYWSEKAANKMGSYLKND